MSARVDVEPGKSGSAVPAPRRRRPRRQPQSTQPLRHACITAAAYALVAIAALLWAGPPNYAAPLVPSAGIALAAVLTWGRCALPGVWAGAVLVQVFLGWKRPEATAWTLAVWPLLLGLGATAQAWLGAELVKRYTQLPVVLNSPRDIGLVGLLGAGVACIVSASVTTSVLLASGAISSADAMQAWLASWAAEAMGVLIATPAVLTLIGRPKGDWHGRRLTVGLPLLLAMLLTSAAMLKLDRLEDQRLRATFERDVDRLASDAQARLQVPLYALQALNGIARAQPLLDSNGLQAASQWWLQQPQQLQAMGYSVRVPRLDLERFEAAVQQNGLADYRIQHRDGGAALATDDEVLAIRLIEPITGNAAALGMNMLSIPAARAAVAQTRRSGQPAATAALPLTQAVGAGDDVGVVVFQALFDGQPTSDPEREVSFRGVVFVTLRAQAMLAGLGEVDKSHLSWCLVEPDPQAQLRRLAGPAQCETRTAPALHFQTTRQLELAGHDFELRVDSAAAAMPLQQGEGSVVLSLAALAAVATLGALLLVVTGQNRRVQISVRAATATLRREVTERTHTQAALADSEERLRSILNHLPIGVMFLDAQGRLLECNPRLCEMLGDSIERLRGLSLVDLMHPDERAAPEFRDAGSREAGLQTLSDADGSSSRPMRLQRSDGSAIWVHLSTSALREGQDARGRRVGVVQDITEHMQLRDSERALQEAEASSRAKSEFVSRMSHELRTPLNAMIGFAQLLGLDREPGLSGHQMEWTQQIQRAGWHLLEMINDTLDLARIESGAVKLSTQAVSVPSLVKGARALVSALAEKCGIEIEENLSHDAVAILGDATRTKQVLTNLLSNAVKYNVAKGRVWVSARPGVDGDVVIAVTDTGLGMTPEQLANLFQPYNRLGREASDIEGTGIGLVISRRLVELMGGTLEARSVAGKGSTFTLRLPAASLDTAPEAPAAAPYSAPYQQRTVHYVEDNPTNVEVMRGMLLQRPQVKLDVSTSGLDGLENIRRSRPDLVLLDMQLPDISGLELLRHLKDDPELADIPILVVSADATTARMSEALNMGAVGYLTKPVDVTRLLSMLDDTLGSVDTRWG